MYQLTKAFVGDWAMFQKGKDIKKGGSNVMGNDTSLPTIYKSLWNLFLL